MEIYSHSSLVNEIIYVIWVARSLFGIFPLSLKELPLGKVLVCCTCNFRKQS